MKTILIADDHDHLRVLVSKTLGGPDYRILEARDGDEAFDAVLRHRPDIVILDWMMPGRSGIEVVQALRAHQQTAEIPIVMLTAKAQSTSRAYATSLDVQGYLAKPFSPIELMETVEKILGEGSCT
jgi:two-component system phosphate regulon response regulator PhoB